MTTTSPAIYVRPAVEDAFFGRGDIVFQREDVPAAPLLAPEADEDMVDTQIVRIPPWDLPEGLSATQLDIEFAFVTDEFMLDAVEPPCSWARREELVSLVGIVVGVPALWLVLLALIG